MVAPTVAQHGNDCGLNAEHLGATLQAPGAVRVSLREWALAQGAAGWLTLILTLR
jgi:hypothetical protein